MNTVKSHIPKAKRDKTGRRFMIESDEYATEYSNSYLGALFHYYGMRISRGGAVTITDQTGASND
ncbi:hypothetical protein SEA_ZOOMAN_237 [Microbacterium phage Zooman]|nr:hypothetical protein SEA_ZOOMAN_237 [Microbacterium phage Zooman]